MLPGALTRGRVGSILWQVPRAREQAGLSPCGVQSVRGEAECLSLGSRVTRPHVCLLSRQRASRSLAAVPPTT